MSTGQTRIEYHDSGRLASRMSIPMKAGEVIFIEPQLRQGSADQLRFWVKSTDDTPQTRTFHTMSLHPNNSPRTIEARGLRLVGTVELGPTQALLAVFEQV